jgi:hypothetical protein
MRLNKQTILCLALVFGLMGWGFGQSQSQTEIERFDQEVAKLKPKPKSIDIAIDVIGLDIQQGSAAEDQLSQVAAAAAGRYYPVADEKDLARVFTQVTTGQTSGGGGGMVLPSSGIPVWVWGILGFLLVSIIVMAVTLATMRRKKPVSAGKIQAFLDVRYHDGRQMTVEISDVQTSIGRAPDNSLVIPDSDVSAYHAEIVVSGMEFVIRDLGSANGTSVNGKKVREVALFLGDEILLGKTKLFVKN